MNIITTQYSLETKSLDIYLAGCKAPHCKNCHNPESWDFNQGKDWTGELHRIERKIQDFRPLINNIMLMGGEPLDQNLTALGNFTWVLNSFTFKENLWFFTKYPAIKIPDFVKRDFHYIKCGPYIEELKTEDNIQHGIKLASSNQIIYKKWLDYE